MAEVHVWIAGRNYRMACDEGQEEHLRALAARLDGKMTEMRVLFGEIGDQRITIMAALALIDEASDAETRAGRLSGQLQSATARAAAVEAELRCMSAEVGSALESVVRRIERLTAAIAAKHPEQAPPADS